MTEEKGRESLSKRRTQHATAGLKIETSKEKKVWVTSRSWEHGDLSPTKY